MPVEAAEKAVPVNHATARKPLTARIQDSMPRLGRSAQGGRLSPVTATVMILFHVGAIAALFMFSWTALICAVVLWFIAANMGIGMCYHRLLTHRGYKCPKWLEYMMAVGATLSLEGGPIFWVAVHRAHHQLSDHEGDPHSPTEGGWWAHIGWILCGVSMHAESATLAHYAPDLAGDRFYLWLSKYHWVPMVVVAGALYAIGGWPCVMWGIFLRVVLALHATWLVNSATHMWGSRRFETRDQSRNSWWVAMLTGGEGWHNNHHAYPVSARHGLAWYEFDQNYICIWLLEKVGLIWDVNVAHYDKNNPKPAGVA